MRPVIEPFLTMSDVFAARVSAMTVGSAWSWP